MSWREFRYNIRSISLLAVGGVTFTTAAVAAVVHFLLAGTGRSALCWAPSISPPDEVAPMAIARRLGLPRRTMVVLEGEGLANDATALILYKFAVTRSPLARFVRFGISRLSGHYRGRIVFGVTVGLRQPAPSKMGRRPTHRNPALPTHAVRRLLGARISRWLGGCSLLAFAGFMSAGTDRC